MKKVILSLSLFVSAVSFAQSKCCNVVDSAGVTVVSTNGNCVVTSAIAENCTDGTTPRPVVSAPKLKLKASDKTILMNALEGVKFRSNSDVLLPESYSKLDAVAELMKAYKSSKITIDGYTDNTGNDDHNRKLSLKRANAAKARLIKDGISASRITTHGYGEENPIATNDTAAGRAKNRRCEFNVYF